MKQTVMCFYNKIIRRIEWFWWIKVKHDMIGFSRKLGVKIGSSCLILDDPLIIFGSEPYLITLGNNVEVVGGARFITLLILTQFVLSIDLISLNNCK